VSHNITVMNESENFIGLWFLMPLSTIFQLYIVAVSFIGESNWSSQKNHRPATSHRQTLSHNVSSTPRHE